MDNKHKNRLVRQYDKDISSILRIIRNNKALTIREVANKVGISYQQYHKYETGKNRISIGRFMQISKALDIELSGIFELK